MDDLKLLDAVERYITGEMSPDERMAFEGLRKSNPEIDQAVVEHTFFLQQLHRFDDQGRFKAILNETHIHLAETGAIESPKLKGTAKVVYLFNRYKRSIAIAASIAGILMLSVSAVVWSFSPGRNGGSKDVEQLSKEVTLLKHKTDHQANEINKVKAEISAANDSSADDDFAPGGTGFLISTKGYLITNAHVVDKANNVAVQNTKGKEFHAKIVYTDEKRDIAVLKIIDTAFKTPSSIPYTIRNGASAVAEPIYSLGFPRNDNDIVYGEGYLAAKTGYNGDTLAVQISINANKGNSGSPIINRNGEVIGVLNARQTSAEGAVFAVQSKYIYNVLNSLQKSDTTQHIKLPSSSSLKGADRTQQVKKISDYVYMVKVN